VQQCSLQKFRFLGQAQRLLVTSVTSEADVGRIMVQGQPGQKVSETSSLSISWAWWRVSVFLARRKIVSRRITV
jgi:hypothetical protein